MRALMVTTTTLLLGLLFFSTFVTHLPAADATKRSNKRVSAHARGSVFSPEQYLAMGCSFGPSVDGSNPDHLALPRTSIGRFTSSRTNTMQSLDVSPTVQHEASTSKPKKAARPVGDERLQARVKSKEELIIDLTQTVKKLKQEACEKDVQHEEDLQSLKSKVEQRINQVRYLKKKLKFPQLLPPIQRPRGPQSYRGNAAHPERLGKALLDLMSTKFTTNEAKVQALSCLFNSRDTEALAKEVLETAAQRPLARNLLLRFVESSQACLEDVARGMKNTMEDSWTPDLCLFIRQELGLSEESYQRLRYCLSFDYNKQEDRYEPKTLIGSVPYPTLRTSYVLRKKRREYYEGMNPTVIRPSSPGKGSTVIMDIKSLLISIITKHRESGQHDQRRLVVLKILWSGDAANMFLGVKQTELNMRIAFSPASFINSPFETYTTALFTGSDTYEQLSFHLPTLAGQMVSLSKNKLVIGETTYSPQFLLSADYAFLSSAFGHAGASATHPCLWCEVSQDQLANFDETFKARDVDTMAKRAHKHATPFTCDICNKEFKEELDVQQEVGPANDNQRRTFQRRHLGQHWHRPPLFPIKLTSTKSCILHLLLRIVDQLFHLTIRTHVKDTTTADLMTSAMKVCICP
jgi:hypothetical protein